LCLFTFIGASRGHVSDITPFLFRLFSRRALRTQCLEAAYSYASLDLALSLRLPVRMSVLCKMDEPIEIPFGRDACAPKEQCIMYLLFHCDLLNIHLCMQKYVLSMSRLMVYLESS